MSVRLCMLILYCEMLGSWSKNGTRAIFALKFAPFVLVRNSKIVHMLGMLTRGLNFLTLAS